MSDRQRERDLVLAPNEYAFISDQTKGNINVYVGPYKTSLANTDQPVYFNFDSKRFIRCSLEDSMKLFATAPEGWYLVMKNPARDQSHPTSGTINNLVSLDVGHKVNISGPTSFALWPGQMMRVIKGHHIRSNQYLLVRVYDEDAARKNWGEAVVKRQAGAAEDTVDLAEKLPELTMGTQLIIQGTSVSFYIPPTGVEVVRDHEDRYIRQAVTLERLEYCILLDEDGDKRFIQGPAVVFPEPTEVFVEREGTRKFKAIELNEISGIYVKVIVAYEEGENSYQVGEELFITGKEQMIYSPRPEHAIIRYGEQEIHHAIAIPAGEGRYVMNRETGQIRMVRGPTMFLADPRKEVVVRRMIDESQVKLWFPGNSEALAYNKHLKEVLLEQQGDRYLLNTSMRAEAGSSSSDQPQAKAKKKKTKEKEFAGDQISRNTQFSAPRTITLNTKYDGAVTISLWTGYAILVVSKSGDRKVIVGPQTYLLEYDESLEAMTLSTGTPKNDNRPFKTAYLRVTHNKVSDEVTVETQDLCQIRIRLSYRVNFEGEPERWFGVENYVKFLTDHMRSVLRNAVKHHGVQAFYADAISIIRETVLGVSPEGGGKRPGRLFEENGMRIYDVEVLDVVLGDADIGVLLTQAQHAAVHQTLKLAAEVRKRDLISQTEEIKRELSEMRAETQLLDLQTQLRTIQKKQEVSLKEQAVSAEVNEVILNDQLKAEQLRLKIQELQLSQKDADLKHSIQTQELEMKLRIAELNAEVRAVVSKAEAISPELVSALQAFSDRALVERVSASMSPLAILGGKSVSDVISGLLRGTPLEKTIVDWSQPKEELDSSD